MSRENFLVTNMEWTVVRKLHLACGGENPSGTNLEYSPAFLEMMHLGQRQPDIQYGSTIVAAKEPNWNILLDHCIPIARETRDLRVGVLLVDCLAKLHHWRGLAEGLELITAWIVHFWETLFPELDVDEDRDPTARLSCMAHLISDDMLIQTIYDIPIVESRTFGKICLRDYQNILFQSNGPSRTHITAGELDVAFREASIPAFDENHELIKRCIASVNRMNQFLVVHVGSSRWSGARLIETLEKIEHVFQTHSSQKPMATQVSAMPEISDPVISVSQNLADDNQATAVVDSRVESETQQPQAKRTSTQITSRAEATVAIDNICAYFEINEPASPVPLLLQRAKRLIPMSFVEILRELAPNEGHQFLQHLISAERLER